MPDRADPTTTWTTAEALRYLLHAGITGYYDDQGIWSHCTHCGERARDRESIAHEPWCLWKICFDALRRSEET